MNLLSTRLVALLALTALAMAPQLLSPPSYAGSAAAPAAAECRRTLATYPTLHPGDRRPAVRTLQCALNDLGPGHVVVDGFYGPQTRRAVARIEGQFEGGPVNPGEIGPAFWQMLYGCQLPNRSLERGDQGHAVVTLQRALRAGGAEIAVDGDFGAQTESVLKAFQRSFNHTATGRTDRDTRYLICWGAFG
jgi:peptidoglycan hydrolase-like protein with peptidoglycan-binding domain